MSKGNGMRAALKANNNFLDTIFELWSINTGQHSIQGLLNFKKQNKLSSEV